jgi:hypothetical protein
MIEKLTPILVVDRIEPCLVAWKALGYEVTVRVPEKGTLGFVILAGKAGEIMLHTKDSLGEDLPAVARKKASQLLYADVPSLAKAVKAFGDAKQLVPKRTTFYGADEVWLELSDGQILGLAEHRSG